MRGSDSWNRNFSEGQPVDCIETEKSRIILHELESDWWLLAVWLSPSISLQILTECLVN